MVSEPPGSSSPGKRCVALRRDDQGHGCERRNHVRTGVDADKEQLLDSGDQDEGADARGKNLGSGGAEGCQKRR